MIIICAIILVLFVYVGICWEKNYNKISAITDDCDDELEKEVRQSIRDIRKANRKVNRKRNGITLEGIIAYKNINVGDEVYIGDGVLHYKVKLHSMTQGVFYMFKPRERYPSFRMPKMHSEDGLISVQWRYVFKDRDEVNNAYINMGEQLFYEDIEAEFVKYPDSLPGFLKEFYANRPPDE